METAHGKKGAWSAKGCVVSAQPVYEGMGGKANDYYESRDNEIHPPARPPACVTSGNASLEATIHSAGSVEFKDDYRAD